ncbi:MULTISPECIES: hypothetical protein [Actinomadura]|uniref:hypothetical protein n=1 Tax=Actinomadura TaxID=1988 RepID=UPI00040922E4|nr:MULTISPECIES: hypothetical protein [Actinomadura]
MNRRHLAALLLVPALALTGCGGEDDSGGGSSAQTPAAGAPSGPGAGQPGGDGGAGGGQGGTGAGQGGGAGSGGANGSGGAGGAGGSGGGGTANGAPTGPPPAAVNAFTKCMRDKGVDIPADIRQWQPPATPSGDMQRAMAVCMQVMASAAPRG